MHSLAPPPPHPGSEIAVQRLPVLPPRAFVGIRLGLCDLPRDLTSTCARVYRRRTLLAWGSSVSRSSRTRECT